MNPANAILLLTCRAPAFGNGPGGYGALRAADVAAACAGLPERVYLLGMASIAGDFSQLHRLWAHTALFVVDVANELKWQTRRGSDTCRSLAALGLLEVLSGDRCIVCNGTGRVYHVETANWWTGCHSAAEIDAAWQRQDARRQALEFHYRSLRRLRRHQFRAQKLGDLQGPLSPGQKRKLRRVLMLCEAYAERVEQLPAHAPCESCNGSGKKRITDIQRAWALSVSRRTYYRHWEMRYVALVSELQSWQHQCLQHVRRRLSARAA